MHCDAHVAFEFFKAISLYWWQVLRDSCSCWQGSSLRTEHISSNLPVPLLSLSFESLNIWYANGIEDTQRRRLSTSSCSILENQGTSKWSRYHRCPQLWLTIDQDEFDVQLWEKYLVPVRQRVLYNVPCSARHQFFPCRPVLLFALLNLVATLPAQKERVLDEPELEWIGACKIFKVRLIKKKSEIFSIL